MSNNSNPHQLDEDRVRRSGIDSYVSRAEVIDQLPAIHSVRVNPRDENAPFVAPVLTPNTNSFALPDVGSRVMLLYITDTQAVVLGGVYLLDENSTDDAAGNDYIIGNENSFINIQTNGTIKINGNKKGTIVVQEDGTIKINGNDTVTSSDGKYEIQKNGTDGEGIINIKT